MTSYAELAAQAEQSLREADIKALDKALAETKDDIEVAELLAQFIGFPLVTAMVEKRLAEMESLRED